VSAPATMYTPSSRASEPNTAAYALAMSTARRTYNSYRASRVSDSATASMRDASEALRRAIGVTPDAAQGDTLWDLCQRS
jgi:hypothetical protein